MTKTIGPAGTDDFASIEEAVHWLNRVRVIGFDASPRGNVANVPMIEIHIAAGTFPITDTDYSTLNLSCEARVFFVGAGVDVTILGGTAEDIGLAAQDFATIGFFDMTIDASISFTRGDYVMLHGGYGGFSPPKYTNNSGKMTLYISYVKNARLASPGPNVFESGINCNQCSLVDLWDNFDAGGGGFYIYECLRFNPYTYNITNVGEFRIFGTPFIDGTGLLSCDIFRMIGGNYHGAGTEVIATTQADLLTGATANWNKLTTPKVNINSGNLTLKGGDAVDLGFIEMRSGSVLTVDTTTIAMKRIYCGENSGATFNKAVVVTPDDGNDAVNSTLGSNVVFTQALTVNLLTGTGLHFNQGGRITVGGALLIDNVTAGSYGFLWQNSGECNVSGAVTINLNGGQEYNGIRGQFRKEGGGLFDGSALAFEA